MIAPYWPNRPWFPLLTQLSFRDPLPLPLRPDLLSQGDSPAPLSGIIETDGLVLQRERLESLECASGVISTLMGLRRASTNKVYERIWAKFVKFSSSMGRSFRDPGIPGYSQLSSIRSRSVSVHQLSQGPSLCLVGLLWYIVGCSPSNSAVFLWGSKTQAPKKTKIPQMGSSPGPRLTVWTKHRGIFLLRTFLQELPF